MLDLFLIMMLGFVGSFGHCLGMCAPLTVAFSLSGNPAQEKGFSFGFHLLLNLGRIVSYGLVGGAMGGIGSALIAGGQMAGAGSEVRRAIAIFTGLMLIWLSLIQIKPKFLPSFPFLHPLSQGKWRDRLNATIINLAVPKYWYTPALLGIVWGLIPCGFLYTAQIKAAQSGSLFTGMVTMLAFGLGTLPTMLGVGIFTSKLSSEKRSQLFSLGGWVTLAIGIITLLRTDAHVDYTGHAALIALILALIARPLGRVLPALLYYRRVLGVFAFGLALVHTIYMLDHTFKWKLQALDFMLPQHQWGIKAGILALVLMIPAAFTSSDRIQSFLGKYWRKIHLLAIPVLILAAIHTGLIGSHYLGGFEWKITNKLLTLSLAFIILSVLLLRLRLVWSLLSLEKFYVSANSQK